MTEPENIRRKNDKKRLYSSYRLLDNMLSGISRDVVEYDKELLDVEFSFRPDDCYMLIIGYKKSLFQQYTPSDAYMMKCSDALKDIVSRTASKMFISYDILYLNPLKYWCILFSPETGRGDATEFSVELTELFNRFYSEKAPGIYKRHIHCSALSSHIDSYSQIAETCESLRLRKELTFFCLKSCVLTGDMIREHGGTYSYDSLANDMNVFRRLLVKRDLSVFSRLEEICMSRIRNSFDFGLCRDFLSLIKNHFHEVQFCLLPGDRLVLDFELEHFTSIIEMHQKLNSGLTALIEALENKKPVSRITAFAVMEIESEYNHPLSVEEIAASLDVSSRYLRKVFKSEMGVGIHHYLTSMRITKAKELLLHSDLKINQIAAQVGMDNPRYFCQFFKKQTGMLPSEFAAGKTEY